LRPAFGLMELTDSASSWFRVVMRFREAGARLLGLAALDENANPSYDVHMAEMLAAAGMDIAALTPKHFAEWLAKTIS
jgi:VWA domain containing CoxE-like protein